MLPLVWVPQLSINNESIDAQHQYLFELYNRVFEMEEDSIDQGRLLGELLEYAKGHFHEEESLMLAIGYPQAAFGAHQRAHETFVATLGSLKSQPVYATLDFIREWLLLHIFIEDRKIGTFLRGGLATK